MKKFLKNDKGAIAVTFAILLAVSLGSVGIGVEVGKWYLIKAEITKAADAAALMGARNLSNPNLDEEGKIALMDDFGKVNFSPGYLGTPGEGEAGSISFTPTIIDNIKTEVAGTVSTGTIFARLFGVDNVSPGKTSVAGTSLNIEIMLTQENTYCSNGYSHRDALKAFARAFEDYQDTVKMGVISFSLTAHNDFPMQANFIENDIEYAIDHGSAPHGITCTDVVFDLAGDRERGGFTDEVTDKYIIFMAGYQFNGFTDYFTREGVEYYGAVYYCMMLGPSINDPDWIQKFYVYDPYISRSHQVVPSTPIGNGTTETCYGGYPAAERATTKWHVIDKYAPNAFQGQSCFDFQYSNSDFGKFIVGENHLSYQTNEVRGVIHKETIAAANNLKNLYQAQGVEIKVFAIDYAWKEPGYDIGKDLYMVDIASGDAESEYCYGCHCVEGEWNLQGSEDMTVYAQIADKIKADCAARNIRLLE